MKVAIYARTSKEDSTSKKVSIPQQTEDARTLAARLGHTVCGVYEDRDLSGRLPPEQYRDGAKKIRPALSALLRDIEAGKIQAVIVRRLDRLGRRGKITLDVLEHFSRYNVAPLATHETLPTGNGASAEFSLAVMIAAAQYEVSKGIENVTAAKAYSKRHGRKMSVAPYGYNDTGKRGVVIINADEAAVVVDIFRRFLAGETTTAIAYALNEAGTKHWTYKAVTYILKNPAYIGLADSGESLIKSESYADLGIIDKATWLRAQKLFASMKGSKGGSKRERHLLSGLLRCGICGLPLGIYSVSYRGYKTTERAKMGDGYRCLSHRDPKRHPALPMVYESHLIGWIQSVVLPGVVVRETGEGNETGDNQAAFELSKIETNLEALKKSVALGKMDATDYMDIVGQSKARIAALRSKMDAPRVSIKRDISALPAHEKREYIHSIIRRITVYRTHYLVEFNPHVYGGIAGDEGFDKVAYRLYKGRYGARKGGGKTGKAKQVTGPLSWMLYPCHCKPSHGYVQEDFGQGLVWTRDFTEDVTAGKFEPV